MPSYSELETTVICPICGQKTEPPAGVIHFQWGEIPRHYRIGDQIVWLQNSGGHVLAHGQVILEEGQHMRVNVGEPQYEDVIVFDNDPVVEEFYCEKCHAQYEALAVEIRGSVLAQGKAFAPGEVKEQFGFEPREVEIVIIQSDSYIPRPDWSE